MPKESIKKNDSVASFNRSTSLDEMCKRSSRGVITLVLNNQHSPALLSGATSHIFLLISNPKPFIASSVLWWEDTTKGGGNKGIKKESESIHKLRRKKKRKKKGEFKSVTENLFACLWSQSVHPILHPHDTPSIVFTTEDCMQILTPSGTSLCIIHVQAVCSSTGNWILSRVPCQV